MTIKTSLNVTIDGIPGEDSKVDIELCYTAVDRRIRSKDFVHGLYNIQAEDCPELAMNPKNLSDDGGMWVCANRTSFDEHRWSCQPNGNHGFHMAYFFLVFKFTYWKWILIALAYYGHQVQSAWLFL